MESENEEEGGREELCAILMPHETILVVGVLFGGVSLCAMTRGRLIISTRRETLQETALVW